MVSEPEYSVSWALNPLMSQRPVQGSPSSSGFDWLGAVKNARATMAAPITMAAMTPLRETKGRVTT